MVVHTIVEMKNEKKLILLITPLVFVAGFLLFKFAGGLSGDNQGVINLSGNSESSDAQANVKLIDRIKKKLVNNAEGNRARVQ